MKMSFLQDGERKTRARGNDSRPMYFSTFLARRPHSRACSFSGELRFSFFLVQSREQLVVTYVMAFALSSLLLAGLY